MEIRYCRNSEKKELQRFVDQVWSKDHVLAQSERLLSWQYEASQRMNFVVANEKDHFQGGLGFIPLQRYDSSGEPFLWLALWKIDQRSKNAGLGLRLLRFLEKDLRPSGIAILGLNEEVKKTYLALGYQVGTLSHYYVANEKIMDYQIFGGVPRFERSFQSSIQFKRLSWEKVFRLKASGQTHVPRKTPEYFIQRYGHHPFYDYEPWGVFQSENLLSFLVLRKVEAQGRSALRWVDFYGDSSSLKGGFAAFQSLLQHHGAEYLDCYQYGLKPEIFYEAGLSERDSSIIIPNFFEPFLKENVEIHLAYRLFQSGEFMAWKGDGDQDRPNQL